MVGIHERSGREKISTAKVRHVACSVHAKGGILEYDARLAVHQIPFFLDLTNVPNTYYLSAVLLLPSPSSTQVAHIMNNELQRKYLTSIKRLMTYAQTKRTDVAPSMKVLNK
jgi:hypothetical protein